MMRLFTVAIAATLLSGPASQAGYLLTFDQSAYTGAVGDTVNVTVSLSWDGSGTNQLPTDGLLNGGVGLRFTGGNLSIANVSSTNPAPAFSDPFNNIAVPYSPSDPSPSAFTFVGSDNRIAGLAVSTFFDPATTGSSVELGTFSFSALAPGTLTIQAGRLDVTGVGQFIQLGDGNYLDDSVELGSATLTVTGSSNPNPVPVPPSAVLAGFGVLTLLGTGLRRRLAGQAPPIA